MRISVIIPTHNRPGSLQRTLAALERQTLPPEEFEVLAVDDGSREEQRVEVRKLDPPFHYRLIEKPQGGLASARNRGADEARGTILHFLDDDVLPAPATLEEHVASHDAAPEPVAVVGSLPYPEHVQLNAFLAYLEASGHYDLYKNPRKYPGGRPPMPPMNGNSSISRELFFEIGKYDETFQNYGSEDLELGHRLNKAGVRFIYNPRAVGYHDHVKDFPQFCNDMETAGESLIRVYSRYPEIKVPKKIDVLEDPLHTLPLNKKIYKIVMSTSFALPALLAAPRLIIRGLERFFFLRRLLFPLYRWVGHYHYAVGMRRGLARLAQPLTDAGK